MPNLAAESGGSLDPAACVTVGRAPARTTLVASRFAIIVVLVLWVQLVVHGLTPDAATVSLTAVAGLGARVAGGRRG